MSLVDLSQDGLKNQVGFMYTICINMHFMIKKKSSLWRLENEDQDIEKADQVLEVGFSLELELR